MRSGWEITVQDTCPEGVVNALWEKGIPFFATRFPDPVTLRFRVAYGDVEQVRKLLEVRGSTICNCRAFGMRPGVGRLLRRRVLLAVGTVCATVLLVSNLFVWRIDVQGNERVPAGAVMRAMTAAGAGVGSFWPRFDGEALRNYLLLELPELQWAGVSYSSGAVRVMVREQREAPRVVDNDSPTHIVSREEGLVTEISAKLGQPEVAVGDRVEKGQVLISGAARSTIGTTRPVHAQGTVKARTRRTFTLRQPGSVTEKAYSGKKSTKISLILWGKPLNFYVGSSFSGGTCDKIILDYHLCMEDVFALPVQIVVQRCVYRDARERQLTQEAKEHLAETALMETLEQTVAEGEVLQKELAHLNRGNIMTMTLRAECLEEIGEELPMTPEELRQIEMQNTAGDETTND